MALTVADLNRLMEQVKTDKVRAAITGSTDKLSYLIYDDDGNVSYRNTLIAVLATTDISELNKLRILALYDNSEGGSFDTINTQINNIQNTISDIQNSITIIEARIDGVEDVNSTITNLQNQISVLQTSYQSLTNLYNTLYSDVANLRLTIEAINLDDISDRVEAIENNYNTISGEVSNLDDRVSALEAGGGGSSSTGDLDDRVQALEDAIATINSTLTSYDETIEQLQYNVEQAVQTANNALSSVTNLYNTVSSHTDTISTIQTSIRGIQSDIESLRDEIANIDTSGGADLSNYVTRTYLANQLTAMVNTLNGATILNLHVIGYHDDATLEYYSDYPYGSTSDEYIQQYGMIAAKDITSKEQLLGLTASASTVATWITDIMYQDTIEEIYETMAAHPILSALGYAKPKAMFFSFNGSDTITIDTFWNFDRGCIIRCTISTTSGVSFTELIDFGEIIDRLDAVEEAVEELDDRVSTVESTVSSLQSSLTSLTSRVSSLESRVTAIENQL